MQEFRTEDLRNVILLSHTGAGKTSLAEAMMYNAGVIQRIGKVDDGSAASDSEPEEIKRKSSISTSLAPLEWNKKKINLLDVPGYFDFIGEVKAALRVADAAVIIVDASAGIQVGTEIMWDYANEMQLPRIVFINRIDRENADFQKTLEQIQERFGRDCVPLQLPIGERDNFQGVYDLISGKAEGDAKEDAVSGDIETSRDKLVEGIAETNEELTTKYLEGEEISEDEIRNTLRAGVLQNKLIPVMVGSALNNQGISQLMDAICEYLPSPKDRGSIQVQKDSTQESLDPDDNAPLSVLVFKTSADPYVGRMNYLRVFSGMLNSDSSVWNTSKRKPERIAQLFVKQGKSQESISRLVAGDIGLVSKLTDTVTGDTLSNENHPVSFTPIDFPDPGLSLAVHPKTKADFDKLGTALSKIREEDPSLTMRKEPDTGETILSGYGEAQMEVVTDKIKRKFNVEAELATPKVPYKETISTSTKAEYRHKKQSGGHGQYGHVLIQLDPLPRGQNYEFVDAIVGGVIPKRFIPAVEKGVVEALGEGVLAGYPVVDVKVTLYDGSYHSVDSSDEAFKMAGSHALRKGVSEAKPVLLEPIMNVRVTVPESLTGDVVGDLNGKRARISGMNPEGGINVIDAQAPYSEMMRYSVDLRSMTQGRGTYSMDFSHYEEAPSHVTQKVAEEAKKSKE
ncbi:MAG: elongation factor G [Dehalococcoidia bacterium]